MHTVFTFCWIIVDHDWSSNWSKLFIWLKFHEIHLKPMNFGCCRLQGFCMTCSCIFRCWRSNMSRITCKTPAKKCQIPVRKNQTPANPEKSLNNLEPTWSHHWLQKKWHMQGHWENRCNSWNSDWTLLGSKEFQTFLGKICFRMIYSNTIAIWWCSPQCITVRI